MTKDHQALRFSSIWVLLGVGSRNGRALNFLFLSKYLGRCSKPRVGMIALTCQGFFLPHKPNTARLLMPGMLPSQSHRLVTPSPATLESWLHEILQIFLDGLVRREMPIDLRHNTPHGEVLRAESRGVLWVVIDSPRTSFGVKCGRDTDRFGKRAQH
jgi:hypothetical protein